MPQPISRVRSQPTLVFSGSTFSDNPDLSSLALSVIASWSRVDAKIAEILANMMGADFHAVTEMYLSLSGGAARKSVFMAAASTILPEWQFILLQAIMKATKASRDQRNEFAHHVWGTCTQIPGALILAHPAAMASATVWIRSREFGREPPAGNNVNHIYDLDRIFVYRESDLREAAQNAGHAINLLFYFDMSRRAEWHEEWTQQLLRYPQLQPALQNLIRESSAEVREKLTPLPFPPAPE